MKSRNLILLFNGNYMPIRIEAGSEAVWLDRLREAMPKQPAELIRFGEYYFRSDLLIGFYFRDCDSLLERQVKAQEEVAAMMKRDSEDDKWKLGGDPE